MVRRKYLSGRAVVPAALEDILGRCDEVREDEIRAAVADVRRAPDHGQALSVLAWVLCRCGESPLACEVQEYLQRGRERRLSW